VLDQLCPQSKYHPIYDDAFFAAIERCPKSPALAYCDCYEQAALDSQIRAAEGDVAARRAAQQQAQDAYKNYPRFPTMSPGEAPPLNVPSRADQKKNTFSKVFDPAKRRMIVLLIAGVLLFVAFVSYD